MRNIERNRFVVLRRYDHHSYQSSHGSEDVRSKDIRHRYPDLPSKSSSSKGQYRINFCRQFFSPRESLCNLVIMLCDAESGRYERGAPSEGWSRSASSNISSTVKPFSSMSGGGSSSMSSRDAWASSSNDRKSDAQPPWARTGSTSDRYIDDWRFSS